MSVAQWQIILLSYGRNALRRTRECVNSSNRNLQSAWVCGKKRHPHSFLLIHTLPRQCHLRVRTLASQHASLGYDRLWKTVCAFPDIAVNGMSDDLLRKE